MNNKNKNGFIKIENCKIYNEKLDPFEIMVEIPPGTRIIGFAGAKQVGKDLSATISEVWLLANGFSYEKRAFADQLKEYCVDILGLDAKKLWGTDADKNELTRYKWNDLPILLRYKHGSIFKLRSGHMSYRDVLNIVGTDIHRSYFGDDIWINALFNKESNKDVMIITDIRTLEEVNAVKKRGGIIVKLTRNTGLKAEHEIQKRLANWHGYDYHYCNNGSIKDLDKFVKQTLERIFHK